ncbi:MAG: quinolinate synthase NadA [Candidatus Kariarchaeaceae archaeon]|jgi:quinolinate synthase
MTSELIQFSKEEIKSESERLYKHLKKVGWTFGNCEFIAPTTLEINIVKKEKNAVILAHSYQSPDIIFGVGDYSGDSLGLSIEASKTEADIILFSGVVFMAETAKILSPEKTVIVPSIDAGCSLADSITPKDVKKLKTEYPGVPIVCYVNTTAAIKAEVDVCVTSANVEKIVKNLKEEKIIFLPDINMANYLRKVIPEKEIIDFDGTCIVHDNIQPSSLDTTRQFHSDLIILAHSECPPDVLDKVDFVGGTSDMIQFIRDNPEKKKFMIASECGLSDRLSIDFPDRSFLGSCVLCPYMKMNMLDNILQALKEPTEEQIITLDENIRLRAKKSLDKMFELSR